MSTRDSNIEIMIPHQVKRLKKSTVWDEKSEKLGKEEKVWVTVDKL